MGRENYSPSSSKFMEGGLFNFSYSPSSKSFFFAELFFDMRICGDIGSDLDLDKDLTIYVQNVYSDF